jgi:hypothetical protein
MSSSLFKDLDEQRIKKAREQKRLARETPLLMTAQGQLELIEARIVELRMDPQVDQTRIGDIIRLEQAELKLEGVRELELGLQQEIER